MNLTSQQIEDLFRERLDHLVLADGTRFTRADLLVYIDAFRIRTDETGTPLARQWQVLARRLREPHGAPDPAELAALREAATAIKRKEAERDAIIRRISSRWPVESLAHATDMTTTRIYQIAAEPQKQGDTS
ncbi:hypothetical protein [Streptomyces yaizuensis]|uniref:Uncharacterized protein n=1 Tax=Streptomyces yaizuensis TaxID=2989713 RepID=A0ABQ5P6M9_9ACTN|nr:hypothetical protein [Streptomyces sp. YSPA8]GLF98239.1 hypothetical protein SYYSPA8_28100 [Streptomyces sp. YSPA8]